MAKKTVDTQTESTTLAALTNDPRNARIHTPRTIGAVVDSIHAVGVGRGIVIDENNVVLAGNGTIEAAAEAGITKVLIVDQRKDAVTVVKRLGLTKAQKARLAVDDNRAGEFSTYDPAILKELKADGVPVESLWTPVEWSQAVAPKVEYVAPPARIAKSAVNRPAELALGALKVPLAAEDNRELAEILAAFINKCGSTVGLGRLIADAVWATVQEAGVPLDK